jgi:hypothetical protein
MQKHMNQSKHLKAVEGGLRISFIHIKMPGNAKLNFPG